MAIKDNKSNTSNQPKVMIFNKNNYMLTAISLAIVVLGFILMSGTAGDIYDFRRTVIAPIVVIAGFGVGIFAIFYKKK
jgi:hypothetical protein